MIICYCTDIRRDHDIYRRRRNDRTHEVRQRGPYKACCPPLHKPRRFLAPDRRLRSWSQTRRGSRTQAPVTRVMCKQVYKEVRALVQAYLTSNCQDLPPTASDVDAIDIEMSFTPRLESPASNRGLENGHESDTSITSAQFEQWTIQLVDTTENKMIETVAARPYPHTVQQRLQPDHVYRACASPTVKPDELLRDRGTLSITMYQA